MQTGKRLVVSPLFLAELADVLSREKFRHHLNGRRSGGIPRTHPPSRPDGLRPTISTGTLCDDPNDEYLVILMRAAKVDVLVSGDPHLTRVRGLIPVKTPREFLDDLRVLRA